MVYEPNPMRAQVMSIVTDKVEKRFLEFVEESAMEGQLSIGNVIDLVDIVLPYLDVELDSDEKTLFIADAWDFVRDAWNQGDKIPDSLDEGLVPEDIALVFASLLVSEVLLSPDGYYQNLRTVI